MSDTKDGLQMSDGWIFGDFTDNNRLESIVGEELSDEIRLFGYKRILAKGLDKIRRDKITKILI